MLGGPSLRPLRRFRALRFPKHSFTYLPVAHDGDVFLGDSDQSIMRLSRPQYDVLWARRAEGFQYRAARGASLVGTLGHSARVLSTEDGSVRWVERFDGFPVVLGDSLFIATGSGELVRRGLLAGEHESTTRIFDGPSRVFCTAGQRIVIEPRNREPGEIGRTRCFDVSSGTVIWEGNALENLRGTAPKMIWGEAKRHIYSNDNLIVFRCGFEVVAIGTATGAEVWRATVPMPHYPPPFAAFDCVFIVGGPTMTSITCLRLSDGSVAWTHEMKASRPQGFGPVHQGAVLLLCLDGLLLFLNPESGDVVGRYEGPAVGSFGVSAAEDDLLLSTEYGRIHVARPKHGAA